MRTGLALAFSLVSIVAEAQAPAPLVRTTIAPRQGTVIGQAVRIDVTVLFPGEMPHPPQVRIPEAPGAQVLRFETQATTTRDRVDGQDYVGQTFEFVLFPRRGGVTTVPAAEVTILDRAGDPVQSAAGQVQRIDITVPAGLDPSGPVLTADRVEAKQAWTPDPSTARLKPGDAVIRRIERRAAGVPALGMAELAFTAPDGVRVYVDPPVVNDRVARGVVDGQRTDQVTYVFERGGTFELPALVQPWWSLADQQARTETLPGIGVTVTAAPAPAERQSIETRQIFIRLLVAAGLLGLVAGGVPALKAWQRRRERYRRSADFARRRARKIARGGDPAATYRALRLWRERLTSAELAALNADAAYAPLHERLLTVIFALDGDWDRRDGLLLSDAVARWQPSAGENARRDPLPPLNPAQGAAAAISSARTANGAEENNGSRVRRERTHNP